jgi:hypothetical protein
MSIVTVLQCDMCHKRLLEDDEEEIYVSRFVNGEWSITDYFSHPGKRTHVCISCACKISQLYREVVERY